MATDYYAWTDIRHGDSDGKIKTIKVGSKITEKDVGAEDYAAMIDAKSIRPIPFPDDIPNTWQDSPMAWLKEKIRRQSADDELATLMIAGDKTLYDIEHSGNVLLPPPEGTEPVKPPEEPKK